MFCFFDKQLSVNCPFSKKMLFQSFDYNCPYFVQSHGFINSKLGSVLLFPHIAAIINSDFDDDHDSPKGEVNPNILVNCNDVSDIFEHFVNDNGVSSCLKSLWKTRLCKLLLCFDLL